MAVLVQKDKQLVTYDTDAVLFYCREMKLFLNRKGDESFLLDSS